MRFQSRHPVAAGELVVGGLRRSFAPLMMAEAFLDQGADGGGAGRHAFAPTILVDALDQRAIHWDGDAFGIGKARLLSHAPIMRRRPKSVNAPDRPSVSLVPFTQM